MLSVKGEVKPLSFDHKPSSESEEPAFYLFMGRKLTVVPQLRKPGYLVLVVILSMDVLTVRFI